MVIKLLGCLQYALKTEHLLNYSGRLLHNTIFLKAEFKTKLVCLGLITKA